MTDGEMTEQFAPENRMMQPQISRPWKAVCVDCAKVGANSGKDVKAFTSQRIRDGWVEGHGRLSGHSEFEMWPKQ